MAKDSEIKKVVRITAVYLIEQLMRYQNMGRDEAVEYLMKTSCYEALMDPETDLYLESKESVWDILREEMSGNPYKMLAV